MCRASSSAWRRIIAATSPRVGRARDARSFLARSSGTRRTRRPGRGRARGGRGSRGRRRRRRRRSARPSASASAASQMSPLPSTGMSTCSTSAAIASQSAVAGVALDRPCARAARSPRRRTPGRSGRRRGRSGGPRRCPCASSSSPARRSARPRPPPPRRISPSSVRFHGSAAPPPLRVTFGTGQPKLRSTCVDAVLGAQDLGRLADVRRVGAVELHRARPARARRRPASAGWWRRPRPGRGW